MERAKDVTKTGATNLPASRDNSSADLITQANQFALAIMFPRSKSVIYPLAVNLAKAATHYQEMDLAGNLFHVAFFAAEADAMKRALSLIDFSSRITHTQVYGRGKLIRNNFRAASVIECYINSLQPEDHRAHCYVTKRFKEKPNNDFTSAVPLLSILDIENDNVDLSIDDSAPSGRVHGRVEFIIPCGYVTQFADFQLSPLLPTSYLDQIKAAGARVDCDWCPHFKPDEFKKL